MWERLQCKKNACGHFSNLGITKKFVVADLTKVALIMSVELIYFQTGNLVLTPLLCWSILDHTRTSNLITHWFLDEEESEESESEEEEEVERDGKAEAREGGESVEEEEESQSEIESNSRPKKKMDKREDSSATTTTAETTQDSEGVVVRKTSPVTRHASTASFDVMIITVTEFRAAKGAR